MEEPSVEQLLAGLNVETAAVTSDIQSVLLRLLLQATLPGMQKVQSSFSGVIKSTSVDLADLFSETAAMMSSGGRFRTQQNVDFVRYCPKLTA